MTAAPPPAPAPTLLIVDDEPLMTDFFQQIMARHNYRVLTAESAPAALALIAQEPKPPALVITDMTMPDMDGLALARALLTAAPGVPVLLSTGYDLDLDLLNPPSNVVGTLQKPFSGKTLAERVRAILSP